ncbi:MAG: ComEC/Rec2 family competence protein [Oscillospiraceae bacterium]
MLKNRFITMMSIIPLLFLTSCEIEFVDDNTTTTSTQDEFGEVKVSFIDVGQGDSILIQTDDNNILIDAGERGNSDIIEQYLSENGVEVLDYVIGTHPHSDHIGSMPDIITDYDVKKVILPSVNDDDIPTTKIYENLLNSIANKGLKITSAKVGDTYDLGNCTIEIVAPNSPDYSDLNDYSVVTILTHGDNKFIFTGDASNTSESEMIENNLLEDVDVLKVGHHGSDTASSKEFIEAIKPEYAVISCGEGNKYNHPHEKTFDTLQEVMPNIEIYRTDVDGTIKMVSNGTDISITYENQNS